MTSNHFLLIVLYFLSNFFIFIAEASANTDQEVKLQFFDKQCSTNCEAGFRSCYQKLTSQDRIALMDNLIAGKYIQKLQESNYIYGSDKVSPQMAQARFNKVVSDKCNAIAAAEQAKAAQASASASAENGTSSKSSGSGDKSSLLDAAKQMAPLAMAIPGVKDVYDKAKGKIEDKVKEVAGIGGKSSSGKDSATKSVESKSTSSPGAVPEPSTSSQTTAPVVRDGGGIKAQNGEIGANMGRDTKSEIKDVVESNQPASVEAVTQKEPTTVAGDTAKAAGQVDNPVINKAKESTPGPIKDKADAVTDKSKLEKIDAQAAADKEKVNSDIEKLNNEFKKGQAKLQTQPFAGFSCINEVERVVQQVIKYTEIKKTCGENAASAGSLCSAVRNETVQSAQNFISGGTALLSKATAASESCAVMSNVSLIANGGMLAAQTMCSGFKFRCDFSCKDAAVDLQQAQLLNESLPKCGSVVTAKASASELSPSDKTAVTNHANEVYNLYLEYAKIINAEKERSDVGSVVASTKQCDEHKIDIMTMGAQAAALFSAAMDSKKCEKQLSSNDGAGGNGKPIATTAQFCAQAANASSATCRCAADPSGAGCLGSLGGGSNPSGFAGLQKSGSNVSDFASVGGPKVSDINDIKFDDLPSDIAKKQDDGSVATSPFGSSAAAGAGGAASTGGAPSGSGDGSAAAGEEKSKFAMGISSLAKGFGNLFGTSGGGKPAIKPLSKQQQEFQLQAIKRKIASDQVRAEISTASGKSNFDKIKARYTETRSSLIAGP